MNNYGKDDQQSRHGDKDTYSNESTTRRPLKKRKSLEHHSDASQQNDDSRANIRPRLSYDEHTLNNHSRHHQHSRYPSERHQQTQQSLQSRQQPAISNASQNDDTSELHQVSNTNPLYGMRGADLSRSSTAAPFIHRRGIRGATIRTFSSRGSTLQRQESPQNVSESTTTRTGNRLSSEQDRRHLGVVGNEAIGTNSGSFFARPPPEEVNISQYTELNTQLLQQQREGRIAVLVANQRAAHSRALNDLLRSNSIVLNQNARALLASLDPHGANIVNPQPPVPVDPLLAHLLLLQNNTSRESREEAPPLGILPTNREHQLTNASLLGSRAAESNTAGITSGLLPPLAAAASLQPPLPPPLSISHTVAALAALRGSPPSFLAGLGAPQHPLMLSGHLAPPAVRTVDLYTSSADDLMLSQRQVLLRKQIEFFEVGPEHAHWFRNGSGRRSMKVSIGQVGIRCKHCAAALPPHDWPKGAVYFPLTLRALYQAAQNMGSVHFVDSCKHVDADVKRMLKIYSDMPTQSGLAGKKYWADGARYKGVYETEKGLRFRR